ncbi:MAG: methyl-accepting chemotaxis protein [Comamonas sp.]
MFSKLFKRKEEATDPGVSIFPDGDQVMLSEGSTGEAVAAAAAPITAAAGANDYMEQLVEGDASGDDLVTLPVLGTAPASKHQKTLLAVVIGGLVVFFALAVWAILQSRTTSGQLSATGQALTQSQRLAKSVGLALNGNAQAFNDVAESSSVLKKSIDGLKTGDSELGIKALSSSYDEVLNPLVETAERTAAKSNTIISQKASLMAMSQALQAIHKNTQTLLEQSEAVVSLKLQQGAPTAEIAAASQLTMLSQRIAKSASDFQTGSGASAEAVFLLGKDLNTFKEIVGGLLNGSNELRLTAARDGAVREKLQALSSQYEATLKDGSAVLGNLKGISEAREAEVAIQSDSEPLRQGLGTLQAELNSGSDRVWLYLVGIVLAALLVGLGGWGLVRLQLVDSINRRRAAEILQQDAKHQEQEAKRLNDANQAAILRLMNELQSVAEGDLTQEATVTEDITGAIADSVNYTVEELRMLVGSVQNTATRVAQTTSTVDSTSTELLAASTEQLREIRETGKSILDMATRINQVSSQAQESASVARQSLQAAELGLKAVENSIGGMNSIRDQIQDTSKRIKRLGESSQEIGEITDLISDITEQTNVLALNAAIQAASAGEAGRGFSVVAEEVQRLAERSADATRQISVLVRAIQTDTQDAVAAMERSTQGVVEGARLSDSAGTALAEIDRVSRRLAELILQISRSASDEAVQANEVAENIQHIFAVTEQTSEGTRTTAQQVRELSQMAEELRQSVSRFKIS